MRAKTIRRLVILGVTACVLIALGAGFIYFRLHQRNEQLLEKRAEGLSAFKAGDYEKAMKFLSNYLGVQRNQGDADALFAYAESRSRIEEPNHKEIGEAIVAFKRYLDLRPGDLKAQHLLMDLYVKSGNFTEVQHLADDVLKSHPDDADALRANASALFNLRNYRGALEASQKLNKINPLDIQGQLITLQTMAALDTPVSDMLKRTAQLRADHPNDPRFEMLEGFVHLYDSTTQSSGSEQWKQARMASRDWLLKAAAHPVDDVDFVRQLSAQLDSLRMYGDAQKLLETAAKKTNDPKIKRLLVERLFQNNHFQDILDHLKDVSETSDTANTDLLAFKALALDALGKNQQASAITDALARRTSDQIAIAWATTLRTHAQQATLDPHDAIDQYRAALVRDPSNAVARFYLGEVYARLGESALALQQWARSADLGKSWYRPYYAASQLLLGENRIGEALTSAQMAYQCLPNSTATITNLLTCKYRSIDAGDEKANAALMEDVEKFRKVAPDDQTIAPVYVGLLARTGKTADAEQAIKKIMSASPAPSAATLLQLTEISRTQHFGMEKALLDLCEKVHGDTPRLALDRAVQLNNEGKPKEALEQLKQAQAAHKNEVPWQLAVAHFMEMTSDPGAPAMWMQLADDPKNAASLDVQLAAMQATSLWRDSSAPESKTKSADAAQIRQFLKRTIDRVHALTSDDAVAWQLGYARWLLASSDKDKDSAEAIVRLTNIVQMAPHMLEARLLLATALEQVGQNSGAVEQLQYAARANPQSVDIQMELARLLQTQGRMDQARTYLQSAARSPRASVEARYRIASMLINGGDIDAATQVVGNLPPSSTRQLMLADLYSRQGKQADAGKIYQSMDILSAKSPTPAMIQSAADFQARQGNLPLARKYLARLKETPLSAVDQALTLAAFDERYGTPQEALADYTHAAQAKDTTAAAWCALAGYHLRNNHFDQAITVAQQAAKSYPDDKNLQSLASIAGQAKQLGSVAAYQPLLAALSQEPQDVPAAKAWNIIYKAVQSKQNPQQTLVSLQDLANQYPRYLPLQSVVITQYAAQGNADAASNAVASLMDAFPNSADVAEQAVRVYAAANDWQHMLLAARKWRQRSLNDPMRADLAIAEAQCFMGNPQAGMTQLQPYLERAKVDPSKYAGVIVDYTRALVLNGQDDQAAALLKPLLDKAYWRAHWLTLAELGGRSPAQTQQWIDGVAPSIDRSNQDEVILLAKTWYDVAESKGVKQGYARAVEVLTPLSKQADVKPLALVVMGSAAERASQLDVATQCFRDILAMKSASTADQAMASNELAWLMYKGNGDLAQAQALSQKAVELAPHQAAYQDTLGRIYLKLGDQAKGIDHLQQATKLDPSALDTLLVLGQALYQEGQSQQAAGIVDQIDKLNATLSADQSQQLKALREKVRKGA